MKKLLLTTLLAVAFARSAPAAILLTEVMSSSGTGGTADWIELTNNGGAPVNISGYAIDDDSAAFANARALLGVTTLAAGESAVFIESAAPVTDIPAFRTFWSGSATGLTGVQIGSYTGAGIGFGSGGDQVHLYDGGGVELTNVIFGTATAGASFRFPTSTGVANVAGQFGAFVSTNALANVGSPGTNVVPEPAALALVGLALAAGVPFRSRRRVA